ncbi:MAG: PilN domain-containing protein [Vicinamibacterales bacterium]
MTRINLLASEQRGAKPAATFDLGQKMTVVGALLLVVTATGVGWRYWSIGQREVAVEQEIQLATREEQRLQAVLKEVQEFEARKRQLEQRLTLIDELRKGQNAPVHIIDQVSRALPEMTWMTSLKQDGYQVTIEGQCLTLTSLSDFVGNLEASRFFQKPVEIIDSKVVNGDGKTTPDLIQFSIRGLFQMAGIDSTPAPPRKNAPGGKRG